MLLEPRRRAKNAHCQLHTVQQDANPEAGNRLVPATETGSRDGDSGGSEGGRAMFRQRHF